MTASRAVSRYSVVSAARFLGRSFEGEVGVIGVVELSMMCQAFLASIIAAAIAMIRMSFSRSLSIGSRDICGRGSAYCDRCVANWELRVCLSWLANAYLREVSRLGGFFFVGSVTGTAPS